jgi:imidazole glycerol-phosphate synthase subunit HisF
VIPPRVIPVLQLGDGYLVKTTRFDNPRYVGDPINAVKILNDKQVDELIICDVGASKSGSQPDLRLLSEIASEAFMPVGYGGNVRSASMARRIVDLGIEKIIVASALTDDPVAVGEMASALGTQSILASVDSRRSVVRRLSVYVGSGRRPTHLSPVEFARDAIALGAGEVLVTSIDREGTGNGYDLELITLVAGSLGVPVIALGGAATDDDFRAALDAGASAVAAGARFVFHGKRRAVLITYPDPRAIAALARR